MPRKIDAETKKMMVQKYLSSENMSYAALAECFGISAPYASRIIKEELQAGNGIKPDRRAKPEPPDYMQYVTPLHKHRQELERRVEHKQAELDRAKQELRDFTATLRQLMEDTV